MPLLHDNPIPRRATDDAATRCVTLWRSLTANAVIPATAAVAANADIHADIHTSAHSPIMPRPPTGRRVAR